MRIGFITSVALLIVTHAAGAPGQVVQSNPFQGVTLYSITRTTPRPLNIQLVEIDLSDPQISFRMTPYVPGLPNGDETITQTTRQYIDEQSAQIGINTSFFRLEHSGEARATNNNGIVVSDGHAYSPWDSNGQVGFNISQDNIASIVRPASSRPTGFETTPTSVSLFNAVAGSTRLLNGGSNVAPPDNTTPGHLANLHPRTAAGITPDNRLLLATIDGRQPGFSEGMYLREVADLLAEFGATEGLNLDGGGSTTMAFDYFGDGATRSQLVNRPVGRGIPNTERYNGVNLGVFAPANPSYVPPSGTVHVPSTVGTIQILDDFETGNGRFHTDPDFSGSNRGLRETVDGVGPSKAARDANHLLHGFASHRIDIYSENDPDWEGFRLRHLSGGGDPANNQHLGDEGFVGFWLKTTTPNLSASIGIDENLTRVLEAGVAQEIIADGQWHLYEWDLADASQWESFANGDGQIDGPITTIDSIIISSLIDQDATVWLDAVAYNPAGSLAGLVPEPAAALLPMLALLALGRGWRASRSP